MISPATWAILSGKKQQLINVRSYPQTTTCTLHYQDKPPCPGMAVMKGIICLRRMSPAGRSAKFLGGSTRVLAYVEGQIGAELTFFYNLLSLFRE
jgi:hypothetical protein